jgi:JAB1/Mov34/MPN/PAD-1 ubiquitin protease
VIRASASKIGDLIALLNRHLALRIQIPSKMPATTTTETLALTSTQVVVHPLVLLSAVDHYNRAAKGTKKRVVGILLGQNNGSTINVANSFAGTLARSLCSI